MRGYTSLLSHILGSNPEIKGYSEMHQSYRSAFDLWRLRLFTMLTTKSLHTPKYLYDKLLHNQYQVSQEILNKASVQPLFMIREPESTIKSIINMGEKMTKVVSWYKDEEKVFTYYVERLREIQHIVNQCHGQCFFIDGQQLIDYPEQSLQSLSSFLQLEQPVTPDYDTFAFTGSLGAGDPSKNIKQGKIVKKRDDYSHITLNPEYLQTACDVFKQTKQILTENCQTPVI